MSPDYEVIILGGGLAGLTLAKQLRADCFERIGVVDRASLPCDRDQLKLGESTVEGGAWYLGVRLGMRRHLDEEHVAKFGLRFFFPDGENRDIATRTEMGPQHAEAFWAGLRPPSFQLHRGRLEHALARDLAADGVDLLDGRAVVGIDIGEPTRVHFDDGRVLTARWVVDASGRAGFLRRKLGLVRDLPHAIRAAQGWVRGRIDPEAWSRDEDFRSRISSGARVHSTIHLMGQGYSIWMIPLVGDITSIGVVAHPSGQALAGVEDRAGLEAWLAVHEPQLFAQIEALGWVEPGPRVGDFGAHVTRTLISPARWAMCGEAAAQIDPLYSSGIDLLAVANEMICATLRDDREGRLTPARIERRNEVFAQLVKQLLPVYRDAYRFVGDPRVGKAKIVWDVGVYLGFIAPLIMSGEFGGDEPMKSVLDVSARIVRLNHAVQRICLDWQAQRALRTPAAGRSPASIDFASVEAVGTAFRRLGAPPDRAGLRKHCLETLEQLERLALATGVAAATDLGYRLPAGAIDPGAFVLDDEALARGDMLHPRRGRPLCASVQASAASLLADA